MENGLYPLVFKLVKYPSRCVDVLVLVRVPGLQFKKQSALVGAGGNLKGLRHAPVWILVLQVFQFLLHILVGFLV